MAKVKLTDRQKDEVRKLTQFANRRIKRAFKEYEDAGRTVVPTDLTGLLNTRDEWHTANTPLSRSVVFESEQEYRRTINRLRQFRHTAPDIQTWTDDQRVVTLSGLETALGNDVPDEVINKVIEMDAVQLSEFWDRFSKKARRMVTQYSSYQNMVDTLREFFPEDFENILENM